MAYDLYAKDMLLFLEAFRFVAVFHLLKWIQTTFNFYDLMIKKLIYLFSYVGPWGKVFLATRDGPGICNSTILPL